MQQRRRTSYQGSRCRAVAPESHKGGFATSATQVEGGTNKKHRPLGEMLQEFQDKVIDAAKKLQPQITDSTARPSVQPASAKPPAAASPTHRADVQNEPAADQVSSIANLKERRRKTAIDREAEEEAVEPRPLAKPKAAQKRNKRTTGNTSDDAEQPASKTRSVPHSRVFVPSISAKYLVKVLSCNY